MVKYACFYNTVLHFDICYNTMIVIKRMEGLLMTPSTEYFKKLEPKTCTDCGEIIDEQHESYLYQCEKCLRHVDHN
jgi:hypothetical protein